MSDDRQGPPSALGTRARERAAIRRDRGRRRGHVGPAAGPLAVVMSPVLVGPRILRARTSHRHHTQPSAAASARLASAGTKIADQDRFRETDAKALFGFANLSATDGFSGGGVFNSEMKLVSVLKGRNTAWGPGGGTAFLNLGAVLGAGAAGSRLMAYMTSQRQYATWGADGKWHCSEGRQVSSLAVVPA